MVKHNKRISTRYPVAGNTFRKHMDETENGGATAEMVRIEAAIVISLAILAALAVKIPALFGLEMHEENAAFHARNMSLFVLPFLAVYFAWKRTLGARNCLWIAASFAAAAILVNVFPFEPETATELLTILHLPIALWLAIGIAYAGGAWNDSARRMNFVRFSGEFFIYYVLIALGGIVLTGLTMFMFNAIGLDPEWFMQNWLIPCGASGAVIIAAWLVETKQNIMANFAPLLTRLFTPLFAIVLLVFMGAMLWTGKSMSIEREALIGCDLLLVVVLGLLLYAASARDPGKKPGAFDIFQLVLVVSALIVDVVALTAIVARISEFGFSPNKVAALGMNLILLVNLAWSAWLYVRFLRGVGSFAALERWQTDYLPAYAVWAGLVVVVFPPLFGYV